MQIKQRTKIKRKRSKSPINKKVDQVKKCKLSMSDNQSPEVQLVDQKVLRSLIKANASAKQIKTNELEG